MATLIDTRTGGSTVDRCSIEAWVFKMKYAPTEYRDYAANALENAFDQLVNNYRITGYTLKIYNVDFNFKCTEGSGNGCQDGQLLEQLQCYRKNNGFTDAGAYLAVHRCDPSDYSDGTVLGTSDDLSAWTNASDCHVTTRQNDGSDREVDNFKGTAIMEPSHSFIRHSDSDVSAMTNGEEHDLGTQFQYSNSADEFTPMVSYYKDAEEGDCSVQDASTNDTNTTTLSSCTEKAYDYSGDDVFGGDYC